jgi:hypothetical protein
MTKSMPLVSPSKTVLLLPIDSDIVKKNSDSGGDFTTRRGRRKLSQKDAKGGIDHEREQERNFRPIKSGQVNLVRNSSRYGSKPGGALNPAGIIHHTISLQSDGALF